MDMDLDDGLKSTAAASEHVDPAVKRKIDALRAELNAAMKRPWKGSA